MASANASGLAVAPTSTGLVARPLGPTTPSSPRRVSRASGTTVSPAAAHASAARMPGPEELPTIATLRPRGSGWVCSSCAESNSSSRVSTRITPAWRNSASTAESVEVSTAVWEEATVSGRPVRPPLTATIGLRRETRRARRANFCGLPKDSRYSSTVLVAVSSVQYCSRSLPLTSALSPTETNVDTPTPVRRARSSRATPTALDCASMPTPPGAGRNIENVASRPSALVISPMLLGPTTRTPLRRPRSRRAAAASSAPAIPSLSTTTPVAPTAMASRTTASTASSGTATTTRSTSWPRSVRLAWAGMPSTASACGFTTAIRPSNPASSRLATTRWPALSTRRLAPTTATEEGCSRRAIEVDSARCSRPSTTARAWSVGSMVKLTSTTVPSRSAATTYPASRKTCSIRRFSARVSAVKRCTPRSRAAAATCSSSSDPSPRPCSSSATTKATSAVAPPGSCRSYWASATTSSPSSASRTTWSSWSTSTTLATSSSVMRRSEKNRR